MQKWEYLYVIFDFHWENPLPRWINGQEIKNWKKASFYDTLTNYGENGWELITYTHRLEKLKSKKDDNREYEVTIVPYMIFKRPKP